MTPRASTPPGVDTPRATPEAPWLGLHSFTEGERDYFFGRARELSELYERVTSRSLTVFFGKSGLGKTSLIQAALIPRLRETGFTPVLVRLDHEKSGAPPPEEQILQGITAAGVRSDAPSLWLLLHDPRYGLCGTVQEPPCIVLIIDQFEEIFTHGQAPERVRMSREFLGALAEVVENRVPEALRASLITDAALAERLDYGARSTHVLLSMREDYLHELERSRPAMPSMMDNRMELRLLTGPQAFEATVEPGKIRCRGQDPVSAPPPIISDTTGQAIVRFVAKAERETPLSEIDAVPPLLSLLCAELNAARGNAPQIQADLLQGHAEDILSSFYKRCLQPHPPQVRRFVEDHLLSPGGLRQSANYDAFVRKLVDAGISETEAKDTIAQLIDDRLLVPDDRSGVQRLELTHDILTRVVRQSRDLHQARKARRRAAYWGSGIAVVLCLAGGFGWRYFARSQQAQRVAVARQTILTEGTSEAAARAVIDPRVLGDEHAATLFDEYWKGRPGAFEISSYSFWDSGCLDFAILLNALAAVKRDAWTKIGRDRSEAWAGNLVRSFRFAKDTSQVANAACARPTDAASFLGRTINGDIVALRKAELHRWACADDTCSHVRRPVGGVLGAMSAGVVVVVESPLVVAYSTSFDEKQSALAQLAVPKVCIETKAVDLRKIGDEWRLAVACSARANAATPVFVWSLPSDPSGWSGVLPAALHHGDPGTPPARVQTLSIGPDGALAVATDRGIYVWRQKAPRQWVSVRKNEGKVVAGIVWQEEDSKQTLCAGVGASSFECRAWDGTNLSPPTVHSGDYEPVDALHGRVLVRAYIGPNHFRFGVWRGTLSSNGDEPKSIAWLDAFSDQARLTERGILMSDEWAIRERWPEDSPALGDDLQKAWKRIQKAIALTTDDGDKAIIPLEGVPRVTLGPKPARAAWLTSTETARTIGAGS